MNLTETPPREDDIENPDASDRLPKTPRPSRFNADNGSWKSQHLEPSFLFETSTPERLRDILVTWAGRSNKYRSYHLKEYRRLSRYNSIISNIILFFSSASSIGGFIAPQRCPEWYDYLFAYFLNGLSSIVFITEAYSRVHRFAERSENHYSSSIQFAKFHRKVQLALQFPETFSKNISELVERCRIEYDYLLEMCPHIEDKEL